MLFSVHDPIDSSSKFYEKTRNSRLSNKHQFRPRLLFKRPAPLKLDFQEAEIRPKKIEMDDVLMNYIMDDIELTKQVMADITRQARIMMDKIYETKIQNL